MPQIGERVRLPEDEDNLEQYGELIGVRDSFGMYVVQLDEEFFRSEDDDGIREVHRWQFEVLT